MIDLLVFNQKIKLKKLVILDVNIRDDSDAYDLADQHLQALIEKGSYFSLETLEIGSFFESNKDFEEDCLRLLITNKASKI
jgi:hypothetical protein